MYLAAAVGGVTVLFGFGLWSAFTVGLRRGRAVERARADRRRGPVRLSEAEETVGAGAVTSRDVGSGFDPGVGESIVARMSEVGGSATIESLPGAGTRVTLWVPARDITRGTR